MPVGGPETGRGGVRGLGWEREDGDAEERAAATKSQHHLHDISIITSIYGYLAGVPRKSVW